MSCNIPILLSILFFSGSMLWLKNACQKKPKQIAKSVKNLQEILSIRFVPITQTQKCTYMVCHHLPIVVFKNSLAFFARQKCKLLIAFEFPDALLRIQGTRDVKDVRRYPQRGPQIDICRSNSRQWFVPLTMHIYQGDYALTTATAPKASLLL